MYSYLFVCSRLDTMIIKRLPLIKKLLSNGGRVTICSTEYHEDTEILLKKLNVDLYVFPLKRNKITPVKDIKYINFLRNLFKELKPDLIIAYTVKPMLYSGLLIRNKATKYIPIITGFGYTFQDISFLRKVLKKIVIILYKLAFRNAYKVIVQNDFIKQEVRRLGIVGDMPVIVIKGDGVVLPEKNQVFSGVNRKYVTLCRLLGEKGLRELHNASLQIKKIYPEFQVELYGGKETSPDRISTLELSNWEAAGTLRWKGYCDNVDNLLSNGGAFILPSYHEGMCTAVAEAISYGMPVIGTDIPGIREMIDSNGYKVDVKSVESLHAALIKLIELSDQEWVKMSHKSRALAEESFDRNVLMNKIFEELK